MIVPRLRLLVWAGAILLPLALLAAVQPMLTPFAGAVAGFFFLVVLLDALLAQGRLQGIELSLPPLVRLSKNRPSSIDMEIRHLDSATRRVRMAVGFPPQVRPHDEHMDVLLPPENDFSKVAWACYPLERGNYQIDQVYMETASPLGLWALRRTVPVKASLRVYPNLLPERKNLAALFLHRGALGAHAQRQVGKGRDFEKLREYIPGDGVDDIHWKATAKRGHPVTKVFQIERTQEVYVIIDASRLSARAAHLAQVPIPAPLPDKEYPQAPPTVLERFITVALVLGLAAEQQGDHFGLVTFTDKIDRFVRAANGQAHYNVCRDALYSLTPQIVTPDFGEVTTFIRLRLRRRALLIFLTALDDPVVAENFAQNLDLISRQHLILVNMMKPPAAKPLFSDPQLRATDDLYGALGGHLLWNNLRELEKNLHRRGVRFAQLEDEHMSLQLVTQYLGVKQRQLI